MKYAIIIPDGCADEPQESLGGKTPLEAADMPAMDAVAAAGVVGRANNTPESLPAGSDVANLSLLGYDPLEHFTGRAPLEAAAQGIELGPGRLGRALQSGDDRRPGDADFTAGHISTDRGGRAAADGPREARQRTGCSSIPGVSYRNLLVYRGGGQAARRSRPTRAPRRRTT